MQTASAQHSRRRLCPIRALFAAQKALALAPNPSTMRMRMHAEQAEAAAAAL